jgi:chlorite dismutase
MPMPEASVPETREYVRFAFYRFAASWRALDRDARRRALDELEAVLATPVAPWQLCYSVIGLRSDVDFGVWLKTEEGTEPLQEFERRIRASAAGDHLELAHNFISMTKPSPYARKETDPAREALRAYPEGAPYAFVYPMVKTRAWYALTSEERARIMRGHIAAGHKYPKIRINTSYSYGLDDQEFVVAFEGDDPAEFLDLVHDLRYTEASSYTLRDTPMFTCVLRSPSELVREFGAGALAHAR